MECIHAKQSCFLKKLLNLKKKVDKEARQSFALKHYASTVLKHLDALEERAFVERLALPCGMPVISPPTPLVWCCSIGPGCKSQSRQPVDGLSAFSCTVLGEKGLLESRVLGIKPSTQAAQGTPYIHMGAFVMCGDGNMGHRTQVWPGTQTVGVLLNKKSLCLLPFSQLVFVLGPALDLVALFGRMSGSADGFKGSLRCTKTHLSCSQKRKLSRSPYDLTKSDPMFEVPHFSLSSVCLQLWWLACLSSVSCM